MNFIDRIPTKANRRKITYDDGSTEFVKIEYADEPTTEGTPLSANTFNKMQDDTSLSASPYIGTYKGNGTSSNDTQTIELGFKPQLLIIHEVGGRSQNLRQIITVSNQGTNCTLTDDGFTVKYYSGENNLNNSSTTYGFIAFKSANII